MCDKCRKVCVPTMRKRKYCNISSKSNTADIVSGNTLMQYQELSEEECLKRLLERLDHKNVCQKFRKNSDTPTPTTHNMVSTIHIQTKNDKIDLDMISGCIPNSAYNKKRFAAITIRIDEPKTTALLFSSGKLVITGASSKQMAISAIRSTLYMLQSIFPQIDLSYSSHVVQNIVCNVQIRNLVTIDIKRLHLDFGTSCTYQASIFPGLIFRPDNSPVVLLVRFCACVCHPCWRCMHSRRARESDLCSTIHEKSRLTAGLE